MKEHVLRAARAVRTPAILVALYAVLHVLLGALTERHGLLSPSAAVSPGLLLLAGMVLVLRLALLFVVPAWIAFRVVTRVLGARRSSGPAA